MRYTGVGFRRAAVTMAEALRARLGARPWVQSVVVVWGTLTHETREEDRVVYVQGENLVPWLQAQPTGLSRDRCESLSSAVAHLRDDSTATGIDLKSDQPSDQTASREPSSSLSNSLVGKRGGIGAREGA